MVAIFAGAGFGFGRGSASVLGGMGLLGGASLGRGGEGVFVNAETGNLVLQKQDEYLAGRGPDDTIARTYNSLTTLADDNNDKWRQSTDRRVYGLTGTLNTAGSTVKRVSGDGTEVTYTWDTTRSAYVATDGSGAYDTLVKSGSNWVWTDGDTQTTETYDGTTTKILSATDINGNSLTFAYDGSGRLSTVTTANGEWTRYDYSGSTNNITQVVTGYTNTSGVSTTLTRVRYGYDGSNRLTTVTVDLSPTDNAISDGATYVTTYSYDASGRVSNIAQSDGSNLAIAYDGSGRVSTLTETVSTGVTRVTSLTYGTLYTTITDPTGQVTRLDYDASNNLTKITAPPAYSGASQQVVQFAYNANGDVTSVTDANGKVTSYSNFTANGEAQTITDTLGNTITRTYDAKNNKLSETHTGVDATGAAVSETTRYVYDSAGNLRFSISAEGRVQEWIWSQGLAIKHYTYTDDTYTTAGTPTEANMTSWKAALADASRVTGEYYQYDARGNLNLTSRFGMDNANGSWSASDGRDDNYVVYDQAGELLSTVNGGGTGSTTYTYDGMGRVTAATDINGSTTTYAFNDAATTTTVTMASGYVVTKTYNKSGDLLSVTDSGANTTGGTTSYTYDKLGRVRVATDATGLKTYSIYDNAGRHVGDVDNDGNLVEYRYDADNRLVGTVQYHTAISGANLTALGSESTWNVTLASIRPAASSQDTASWVVYDSEGRVLETIAGDGSATVSTYDASGRLQQTTAYYNKIASATVAGYITGSAPSAVVTPTADSSRDLVARVFYDKDGRTIGKLDGEGYLTQNTWDKAGRLITTSVYATQVAQASRASSSFNTLLGLVGTSADDRVTHFVYDGRSLLRYQIDEVTVSGAAKGRVTAFYYNNDTDSVARTVVYDGYMASTTNYKLANIESLTASLETSSGNRVAYNSYDTAGRLAYTTSPTGLVTSFKYDNMGRVTRTVAFATARTVTAQPLTSDLDTWTASHLADAGNRITRSYYTARGEAAYVVDGEGYVSLNAYDAKGQVTSTQRWANAISVSDTTTFAQVAAAVSGASETRSWQYDSLGRVTRSTDALGVQTTYTYHGATALVNTVTRAANGTAQEQSVSTTTYDAAGRAISTLSASGAAGDGAVNATTSLTYDGRGLVATAVDANSNTVTYTYDLDGRVKTVTNAAGGVTTYAYNAFGQAWQVTDPNGNVTSSWYDKLGRVIAVEDAQNYLTTTSYTVFGDVASVTRYMTALTGTPVMGTVPTGSGTSATTSFTYDKLGRATGSTDALNYTESYAYDTLGNRTSATNKLGGVTNYTYDRLGRLTRQGIVVATSNDKANGNYTGGTLTADTITAGVENATTYTYDGFGNLKTKVEGYATGVGGAVMAMRTTTYTYDAGNHVLTVGHDWMTTVADDMVTYSAVAPSEAFSYDKRGNVIVATDAGGAATYSYYDDLDRKTVEIRQLAAGQWVYTAYSYDANGNLTATKVYDANGYAGTPPQGGTAPTAPTSGSYRETDFTYDGLNRMLTSTVASNAGNVITSGSWNGSAYVTASGSLTTTYQYDADGNVVKLTDANGNTTWSWYDKLSRKAAQLDGEGYLTAWTYNAEGSVLQETRSATKFTGTPSLSAAPSVGSSSDDRITQFAYDLDGNRTSETRLNVAAWTVDATSGALSTAATTSSTIVYTYNALGQVVSKSEPTESNPIATYAYDNTGRLTSESRGAFTDANGTTVTPTTSYAYDALGDLVTTTQAGTSSGTYQALNRVTTNRYGDGGRLLSSTDAEGNAHQYFYDTAGRLKKDAYSRIVNADTTTTSSTTSTVAEAQTKTYDLAGRVLGQSIYSTIGGSFQRVGYTSYQYNNYDQVTSQGTGSNSASGMNAGSALYQVTNQYDGAGRLTGTNSGDGVWKFFSYDKLGNQTGAVTSAGYAFSQSTGFAAAQALTSDATYGSQVNGTYTTYDKRGMATQVIEEGRQLASTSDNVTLTTTRTYNAFGEVSTETNALGNTITYTYNTMGRMVRSESPAVSITLENGLDIWVKPSEDYYYDLGGRQIATRDANGTYGSTANTQGTAYAKAANTGNLTTLALLAGTGYDKSKALVSTEFHADGGKRQTLYDVMGDARLLRDELYSSSAPNLHVEEDSYNRLGQLVTEKHNRATNVADDSTRLVDTYVYDQFGQKIQHANNQQQAVTTWVSTGSGYNSYPVTTYLNYLEKTGYDALGRVTSQTDASGYVTGTAYTWDGTVNTSIGGSNVNLGAWTETTTYANNRTAISKRDLYNRELFKQDLGSHQFSATFDAAGRMATRGGSTYSWYNTGLIASSSFITGTYGSDTWDRKTTSYGYNATGNRTAEVTINDGSQVTWVGTVDNQWPTSSPYNYTLVNETATYDALGRLVSMNAGQTSAMDGSVYLVVNTPAATVSEKYDAAGNIRNTVSTHAVLNANGAVASTVTDSYWFRYDSMNRLVTDKGSLSGAAGAAGTTIVRGSSVAYGTTAAGQDYVYDAAGERVAAIRTDYNPGSYSYYNNYYPGSYNETRENYDYDGAGRIADIRITSGTAVTESYDANGNPIPPASLPAASATGGVTRSVFAYDLMGRQTSQTDYDAGGTVSVYSRTASYALNGFLLGDTVTTKKYESNYTTNLYTSYNTYSATSTTGEYLNGAVGSVTTSLYKNNVYQNGSSTTNSYVWWDNALQGSIAYKPNTSQSTVFNTYFYYDGQGALSFVSINDGRPRTVYYITNGDNQIIRRDESDNVAYSTQTGLGGDPHEIWYRFGGKELGYVSNNGTSAGLTENASISDRQAYQDTGAFRNGSKYASTYTNFAESTGAQINSYSQGSAAGSYVVARNGETLRSIAEQLWGDSSLWYKIADANGMSGDVSLSEGQRLTLPAGLQRTHNSATTLTPYDANSAIGNVNPTTPQPAKKNGCGVFGMILLAVIAVAVTVVTAGAAFAAAASAATGTSVGLGAGITLALGGTAAGVTATTAGLIVVGAASAAVGSIVSQGIGVMTGIQDKFNWGAVAMAGIGGAIGGAFGAGGLFGKGGMFGSVGSPVLRAGLNGMAANVAGQGIGLATGLQSKFDFAGVAAAGVGAMTGAAVSDALHIAPISAGNRSLGAYAGNMVVSGASMLANAATRSAINGSDFGDAVMAALPDTIAQTLGSMLVNGVAGKPREERQIDKILGNSSLSDSEKVARIAEITQNRGISAVRARYGNAGANEFVAALAADPSLARGYKIDARGRVLAYNNGISISDAQALIALDLSPNKSSAATPDGLQDGAELTVTGDRTFGDAVANTLTSTQAKINGFTEGKRDLITLGLGVIRFGPIGSVGNYAFGKVIDAGLQASGLDKVVGGIVTTIGKKGLSILSDSSAEREQAAVDANGPGEASLLVQSGVTILGVTSLLKYVSGKFSVPSVNGSLGGIRTSEGVLYNGITGPGPLGSKIANTFRSGSYTEIVTSDTTTLYRVYGGRAGELGPYWTRTPPNGPVQSMIDSALDPMWGNTATKVVRIDVPRGVTIYDGVAATQRGLVGGGNQVFIPRVDPAWIVK